MRISKEKFINYFRERATHEGVFETVFKFDFFERGGAIVAVTSKREEFYIGIVME